MDYPWDQHKRSERRVGHISVNYARGPVETIVDDSLGDEYSLEIGLVLTHGSNDSSWREST